MEIIRCADAKTKGLKHYFTGRPCKRGHVDLRFVTGGCRTCSNEDQKRYYDADPEKHLASNRAYFQRPEVKEANKLRQREFYVNNVALCRSVSSRCRAERMLRVPSWSQGELINQFYKNCPIGYEVDHIVPLLGELVSGLHVIENLQYLLMAVNRAKRNKFEIL